MISKVEDFIRQLLKMCSPGYLCVSNISLNLRILDLKKYFSIVLQSKLLWEGPKYNFISPESRHDKLWLCSTGAEFKILRIHPLVFSLEGRAWQEPEPSHVTGMALAHCIVGKFLTLVCHCFPPPLDVPTLATRCLRPQQRERSKQRKGELWARKMSGCNFA